MEDSRSSETAKAYVTPVLNAGNGPTVLRDVPIELVETAPSTWYQPQPDGTMRTYLVTEAPEKDSEQLTAVQLWRLTARQGNAIEDIAERRLQPEASDNEAFSRLGYSRDLIGRFATPEDGSSFYQSIDYFRSLSADDW